VKIEKKESEFSLLEALKEYVTFVSDTA